MTENYFPNFDYYIFTFLSLMTLIIIFYLIKAKDNFSSVLAANILSLLMIIYYLLLDAPDVALTEASVGSCASIMIFFLTITKIGEKKIKKKNNFIPLIITIAFFIIMISLVIEMPNFGDKYNITNNYLTNYYIENAGKDIGIKSVTSSILASYRGFDTFGETLVILIGGIGITSILSKNLK